MKEIHFAIVGCIHGDEILGEQVIQRLPSFPCKITTLLANTKAMAAKKRFIDKDLNRIFPGKVDGCYEERLAVDILAQLQGVDYVIDIHSTKAKTPSFCIATTDCPLLAGAPLPIVHIAPHLPFKGALINNVPGISIEFAHTTSAKEATEIVCEIISNFLLGHEITSKEYEVYAQGRSAEPLENFQKISKAGEVFFPVLSGTSAYREMYFKARLVR